MAIQGLQDSDEIRLQKAALRAQFRQFRMEMSEEEHARRSAAICHRIAALPEVLQAESIHSFWPIRAQREVDLQPLLHTWHVQGKTIVLPRVANTSPPVLTHHVWQPDMVFVTGTWGIEEPPHTAPAPTAPHPLILIPALAVDTRGVRLGYGRGFYDALLAHARVLRVVPLFDGMLVDRLPAHPHDARVDVVVTETQTVRISPEAQL